MQTVKDISDLQNKQKFEFENLNQMFVLLESNFQGGIVDKDIIDIRATIEKKWDELIKIN